MANHTLRTGSPASIASTAVRPPREAKTWSRATLSARMEPNCLERRDQKSCRRTSSTLARTRGRPPEPVGSYPAPVYPSTGSPTWDLVLEIGIALCLVALLVLLYRNYRGR